MNRLILATASTCLIGAMPVAAEPGQVVVTANPELNEWVTSVNQELDRRLSRIDTSRAQPGVTYVRFTRREDGRTQDVELMEGGDPQLNRVGRVAVHHLRIPTMPVGSKAGQIYEAAIIVADSPEELKDMKEVVKTRMDQKNAYWARKGEANPVISLAVVSGF